MASDNIELFSYTQPLAALASFTSEKMILSQYISLSAVCYGDQSFNFIFQFSGDGTHWDYSVPKSIDATTGTRVSTPVEAKWTRIRLVSTSGVNMTELRTFVYGVPSNSVLTAQLSSIGNINPKVDISADIQRSVFDEVMVTNYHPEFALKFNQLVSGALYNSISQNRFSSPYFQGINVWTYSGGVTTDGVVTAANYALRLSTNETTLNTDYILASSHMAYSAGVGVEARFTAAFVQPSTRTSNQRQLFGVMNVDGDIPVGSLYNGFLIGYNSFDTLSSELEVAWYRNGSLVQSVPQSSWNIDAGDGSGKAPNIIPHYLNVYKIQIGYLGSAGALFSIMGAQGKFYPLHRFVPYNGYILPQWSSSSMQLGLLVRADRVSTSKNGFIQTSSMSLGLEGVRVGNSLTSTRAAARTATTTETPILAIQNLGTSTTFMGSPNFLTYELEDLFLAVTSQNAIITTVRIYRNVSPLNGTYFFTGNLTESTKISTNETNFVSAIESKTIVISQDATVHYQMGSNEESIRNKSFLLEPGQNYVFTVQTSSATSSVAMSISWHEV